MSIWWSLHLRREAASVPLARRLLLGTMETAGVDPDICYDLSVALSEACANAVEHGGDAATEDYRVTAFIDGDTCRIEVTDSGPGFRRPQPSAPPHPATDGAPVPAAVPAPAQAPAYAEDGRGLFLIEALTDHVRYRNRTGRRGAVVSFDKILKWREGAALPMAS
ncbi:ATP-binding protein [Streptomyces piniterrae]|uniref:ATP-binding protein n=1 Tax=Streptomyces piniterrae TaxID=2571125 RepID=A0A4U0N8Z9_9ACTN|nr:ATP-binding protein [Streptomyces piniterrae]TJZ50270.1 ATP-binding protein [Streptomyces piniterrae]